MLSILLLIMILHIGHILRQRLLPAHADVLRLRGERPEHIARLIPAPLLNLPAAFLLGLLPSSLVLYALASLCTRLNLRIAGNPLFFADLLFAALYLLVLILNRKSHFEKASGPALFTRKPQADHLGLHVKLDDTKADIASKDEIQAEATQREAQTASNMQASERSAFRRNLPIVLGLLAALAMCYLLFYYPLRTGPNGSIHAGASVISDYSAHLGVVSSFARGENFAPSGYPFFSGAGMRYHFFFYFMVANLDALGLGFVAALNLLSSLAFLSLCTLAGILAIRFSGRRTAFFLVQPLILYQSSSAWISFLFREGRSPEQKALPFLEYLCRNDQFIGQHTHDNWGFWNLNVWANQRHFPLGLAVLILILLLCIPLLRLSPSLSSGPPRTPQSRLHRRFRLLWTSRAAWLPPAYDSASCVRSLIAILILLISLPYWHGSVLIASLAILFVLALFSRAKLAYLAIGISTIGAALFFSLIFTRSGAAADATLPVQLKFTWGFLAEDKSLWGVIRYTWDIIGLSLPALVLLPFLQRDRSLRRLCAIAILPLIIALTLDMTSDLAVNHKYIIMARILICCPLAAFLSNLFARKFTKLFGRSKARPKPSAVCHFLRVCTTCILMLLLCLSGLIDQHAYMRQNAIRYGLETNSDFVHYLQTQTAPRAGFLTPGWFWHPFFYTGRQSYLGYGYFPISAGYDAYARDALRKEILSACNGDHARLLTLLREEKLDYALIDDAMRNDPEIPLDEAFFEQNCPPAARFPETDNLSIYDLRPLKNGAVHSDS